jgi:phage shock protein PspC (stress-responsive transcriptional regulator)
MFCTQCGTQLGETEPNFCPSCGAQIRSPRSAYSAPRRLTRSRRDRKVAGVCGGIAEYLNMDPTLIRLLAVVAFFCGGAGFMAYIVAWIVLPEEDLEPVASPATV